ncbi:hypothetical protein [Actinomadura oligospora]|uniref:hypothetical protein n=1 Tax=Actinomadura oligospora TaxID=111804 RepID=UPI000478ED45|nr:hypothetical protein [Actinomadura oligospora]
MRLRSRSTAAAVAFSTVLVASPALTAAPAHADGPCGAGYSRVGVYAVPASGTRVGTLEVYWNATAKKNCALMYNAFSPGTFTYTQVSIGRYPGAYADDEHGPFGYYAGPVYVYAPVDCINVRGGITGPNGYVERVLQRVHCG